MFGWIKNIGNKIKDLNGSIDTYKQDSIIQSLPTVAYVNKAKKLFEQKKYDEAEVVLKEALDISKQDALVYKYLGKIYELRYKFKEAVDYYVLSMRINPQDKEIWLRLGMSRLNCGMVDEALTAFERGDKVTPFNTDIKTGWGMALMKQNKYALARDKFMEAVKFNKYNFTAILLSAVMEIRLCDYESAEMKLAFLVKVAPNESSTYEYANLKYLKCDYKMAEEYAKKSIDINNGMLPAYILLGKVYSAQKDYENTRMIFEKALGYGLENAPMHYEWGCAYIQFFDFEKAREEFEKALELDNEFILPKTGLALLDALDGNFERLTELKERHGDNVFIQESSGLELFSQNRYEDAVDMFNKAFRNDKTMTYNLLHLARAYWCMGNRDKTRDYFEKFVLENPHYMPGYLEYAKWLIEVNDFADAQRKLRKAEKIDKNNIDILNLLFFTSYILVKENVCEYNVGEAISLAQKIKSIGRFDYEREMAELEDILENIRRTQN